LHRFPKSFCSALEQALAARLHAVRGTASLYVIKPEGFRPEPARQRIPAPAVHLLFPNQDTPQAALQ
jgi:hypothetical protein